MARKYVRFNPRIAIKICNLIAEGKSLRSICTDPSMPSRMGFLRWVASMPTLQERYECAIRAKWANFCEDIVEMSDELPEPVTLDGKQVIVMTKGWAARQRLRIDTRKWAAARMDPKKYGERLALSDPDGKPLPAPTLIATADPTEAARIYQELITGPGA